MRGLQERLERSKGGLLKERGARRMGHSGEELRGTDPSKICWEWKVVEGCGRFGRKGDDESLRPR